MKKILILLLLIVTSCTGSYYSYKIELQPINSKGILIVEDTNKWKVLPYEEGDTVAYKYRGIITKLEYPSLYKDEPKFIVKKIEKKWL